MKEILKKIVNNLFTMRDNRQLDKRKVIVRRKNRRWY